MLTQDISKDISTHSLVKRRNDNIGITIVSPRQHGKYRNQNHMLLSVVSLFPNHLTIQESKISALQIYLEAVTLKTCNIKRNRIYINKNNRKFLYETMIGIKAASENFNTDCELVKSYWI